MAQSHPPFNSVYLFQLGKLPIRGRLVMCDQVTQDITHRHEYPPFIAQPLAEALVFSAIMSSTLKNEGGIFTLQIRGNGPLAMLVVDAMQNGNLRGYARYKGGKQETDLRELIGDAQIVFTLDDSGNDGRYQGVVEMVGSSLTESLQHYFTQSEQSRTALKLLSDKTGRASGLYVQWLPTDGEDEDEVREKWLYVLSLLSTLDEKEFIADDVKPDQLLHRLFHDQDLKIDAILPLQAECRCSRDRILNFLQKLSDEERSEFSENNEITVTCEFCNQHYIFEPEDYTTLHN